MMRGIDSRNEIDPTLLLRDTRTVGQRAGDFFTNPSSAAMVLIVFAALGFYLSEATLLILIAGGLTFAYSYTRKQKLPFRLPKIAQIKDFPFLVMILRPMKSFGLPMMI